MHPPQRVCLYHFAIYANKYFLHSTVAQNRTVRADYALNATRGVGNTKKSKTRKQSLSNVACVPRHPSAMKTNLTPLMKHNSLATNSVLRITLNHRQPRKSLIRRFWAECWMRTTKRPKKSSSAYLLKITAQKQVPERVVRVRHKKSSRRQLHSHHLRL